MQNVAPLNKILSRPVWGAWIEIVSLAPAYGETPSRPVWGAWIEIGFAGRLPSHGGRRAPYGARGLKCLLWSQYNCAIARRAPYGARGLKSQDSPDVIGTYTVAPRMGRVD